MDTPIRSLLKVLFSEGRVPLSILEVRSSKVMHCHSSRSAPRDQSRISCTNVSRYTLGNLCALGPHPTGVSRGI